uniref:Uncharacterized protein n=1 Tax=Arundo donax TaxID=35708 RepID=A0A0A8ZQF3_ARUDO
MQSTFMSLFSYYPMLVG